MLGRCSPATPTAGGFATQRANACHWAETRYQTQLGPSWSQINISCIKCIPKLMILLGHLKWISNKTSANVFLSFFRWNQHHLLPHREEPGCGDHEAPKSQVFFFNRLLGSFELLLTSCYSYFLSVKMLTTPSQCWELIFCKAKLWVQLPTWGMLCWHVKCWFPVSACGWTSSLYVWHPRCRLIGWMIDPFTKSTKGRHLPCIELYNIVCI